MTWSYLGYAEPDYHDDIARFWRAREPTVVLLRDILLAVLFWTFVGVTAAALSGMWAPLLLPMPWIIGAAVVVWMRWPVFEHAA